MTATFDLNLRRVRMTESGRWTLIGQSDRGKPIHLCDFCAMNAMCITPRRVAEIVDEVGVAAAITECPSYRAALAFRDELGLEGDFNTIRLGKAWHDRVMVGSKVTLWHSKHERPIGTAIVTERHVGRYCDLAAAHAHRNHTQLHLPAEDAPARLMKVLVGSYGSTFMKPERSVSIIYLRRCDDEEETRDQGGSG